ncbi:Flp pilus assembly protein CpaB [Sporosarcina sp. ANT_H38]|uniref:hypothetical protein n=1 Tax=Sporosarcina sp. ANT_H38 TaxID=2597358 RepID=UPI00165E94EC|nr:hypothetical protein [Sporosarcina sp. ANT_H38]
MKGKTLVIGLVLFVLLSIVAVYFAMKATINDMENGMAPLVTVFEVIEGNSRVV